MKEIRRSFRERKMSYIFRFEMPEDILRNEEILKHDCNSI